MRRADSWCGRSEEAGSAEEKFIFLWIAFNAAYGAATMLPELDDRPRERQRFKDFLEEIVKRDNEEKLEEILWRTFDGPIRVLLGNQYIFAPFWAAVQYLPQGEDWEKKFRDSNRSVFKAIERGNVHRVLTEVFQRLYTLRNQILHGGVTFSAGWGRDQVRDGSRIMASLVPVILEIMRTDIDGNPDSDVWGRVAYPRVNYDRE